MKLKDWLYHNEITISQFARDMDVGRNWISDIIHRRKRPSKRLARDIENATNGEVRAISLRGDDYVD